MTIEAEPVAGTARVVVLAPDDHVLRGRASEFRRFGFSLVLRDDILAALTEVVHDPSAILVVSAEIDCVDLTDVLDLAVAACGSRVVLGMTATTGVDVVSAALRSGVRSTIDLPLSPQRMRGIVPMAPIVESIADPITVGRLTVDAGRHVIRWDATAVELTPREFAVVLELARAFPRMLSLDDLARAYQGSAADARGAVRVVITHVRTQLAAVGGDDAVAAIETIRGVGYRLAG
jgi:DNA-binding response OmpR family regulator